MWTVNHQALPLLESKAIEFRTEFFNLFNTVNYANPISDLNAVPAANFNADGTINPTLGADVLAESFLPAATHA